MSERLVNTGAETGSLPWVLSGLANVVSVGQHTGSACFRLRTIGASQFGSMTQDIILSPGVSHDVNVWVDLSGGLGARLRCMVDKGDGVLVTLGERGFAPGGWAHWSVGSFVAVGALGRLQYASVPPPGGVPPSATILLDDLSLWAPLPGTVMASRFQVIQALREAFAQISVANGYHTAVAAVRFQTPRHADGNLAPPSGPIIVLPAYREDDGPGSASDQGLTDERWTMPVVIIIPRPSSADPFDLLFQQRLCNAYDDMLRVCLGIESTKLGRLVQEITTSKVVWDADTPKPWGSIYFYLQIHEMRERQQLGVA